MPLLTLLITVVTLASLWPGHAPGRGDSADDQRTAAGIGVDDGGRPDYEWSAYGGSPEGTRYAPLDQIDGGNVAQLGIAWTYRTGDVLPGPNGPRFQATPLMVDGRLSCRRRSAASSRCGPTPAT